MSRRVTHRSLLFREVVTHLADLVALSFVPFNKAASVVRWLLGGTVLADCQSLEVSVTPRTVLLLCGNQGSLLLVKRLSSRPRFFPWQLRWPGKPAALYQTSAIVGIHRDFSHRPILTVTSELQESFLKLEERI